MDLCDEAFYFRENGVLIAHKNQVIVARQFNQLRVRNMRRNVAAFRHSKYDCTLRVNCFHDRTHVVHALFERGHVCALVREASTSLIKENQTRERSEPPIETSE